MNVHSILKTKGSAVVTIGPDQTVSQALQVLEAHDVGALVVGSGRTNVLGILSERDIARGLARHGAAFLDSRVDQVMSHPVHTCAPDDSLAELMAQMTDRRIRHLPVMERGRLAGIVSIGDVVKSRLDEMARETEALREYIVRG
jgi:CBS domain-containing protein